MFKEIVDRIRGLPPLPKTFNEINALFLRNDPSIKDLAKILENDPMIVANLLKVANSPLYCFAKEIRNVLQAVTLFGLSATKAIVTDISIKKLLKVDMEPYDITPEEFAKISTLQSMLMNLWYSQIDKTKLDLLFFASLLQETGKILIADEIVQNDETMQFRSQISDAINIHDVEKSYVGTTTAQVTSLIFEHWKFEKKMVEAIRYSENYNYAPPNIREYSFALQVVKTAIAINSPLSQRNITIAANLVEKEGYDKGVFFNAIDKLADSL